MLICIRSSPRCSPRWSTWAAALPGLIIMMMAISFLYSMGISTWFLGTFTTPILMAGTAANLAQVAAGQTATIRLL